MIEPDVLLSTGVIVGSAVIETVSQVDSRSAGSGLVFDLTLPLQQVAEGYRAMNERSAIKTLLRR